MTTIYLIRHSEPIKDNIIKLDDSDSLQIQNEKRPLSIIGEIKAKKLSENKELQNIDLVISSNYVRAISTAKYIANKNNLVINVNENFGERKFGITSWDELPTNFEMEQLKNPTLKLKNGESQIEVANRMYNAITEVLKNYSEKRIVIVSHATAIMFLLIKLCSYQNNKLYFKEKLVLDENFKWNAPEVFKLEFNKKELLDINNIKIICL